jgi:predicted transglutaminase-like cysteine proteinase
VPEEAVAAPVPEMTGAITASLVARQVAKEETIDAVWPPAKALSDRSLSNASLADLSANAARLIERTAKDWKLKPLTVSRTAVAADLGGLVGGRDSGSGRDVSAWASLPPSIFGRFDDFAMSLAGRLAATTAAQAPVSVIPTGDIEVPEAILTDDLWERVRQINGQINRRYRSATDARIYGRNEYWARPSGNARRLADCEDYVLEKRVALIDAGVPADALTIATARTWRGEHHAVLILATSEGDFVLDNLVRDVLPWSRSPYRWGVRQSSSDPLVWNAVTAGG